MKIKKKYVKKFTDLPEYEAGLKGYASLKEKTIYLVKDKSPKSTEYHEEYHLKKRHPIKPKSAEYFVKQEILANLYEYKKCGKPKRILFRLWGMSRELVSLYGITYKQSEPIIRRVVKSIDGIPTGWIKDLEIFKNEIANIKAGS